MMTMMMMIMWRMLPVKTIDGQTEQMRLALLFLADGQQPFGHRLPHAGANLGLLGLDIVLGNIVLVVTVILESPDNGCLMVPVHFSHIWTLVGVTFLWCRGQLVTGDWCGRGPAPRDLPAPANGP